MRPDLVDISKSIDKLDSNLTEVARVAEWADLMGYQSPKKFSRRFLRHYSTRPNQVLNYIRLKSISKLLRGTGMSNFEIAQKHGIPDEKGLNKFVNYHLGCSPSKIKKMPEKNLNTKLEKLGSKIG